MDPSKCFIHAMNCPEDADEVRAKLRDAFTDYRGGQRDLTQFHTLIAELRYGSGRNDPESGFVFVLVGDDDEDGNERQIVLGWGELQFMSEVMRQLSILIPFTPESDRHPLSFLEMDAEMQQFIRRRVGPIEWHNYPDEFMDTRFFAIGLNGQMPHRPKELELL